MSSSNGSNTELWREGLAAAYLGKKKIFCRLKNGRRKNQTKWNQKLCLWLWSTQNEDGESPVSRRLVFRPSRERCPLGASREEAQTWGRDSALTLVIAVTPADTISSAGLDTVYVYILSLNPHNRSVR